MKIVSVSDKFVQLTAEKSLNVHHPMIVSSALMSQWFITIYYSDGIALKKK
jgi:hypothetical protein